MNKAQPKIAETSEMLKEEMTRETHPLKRQRLHALYLLASQQAKTRGGVASLLGVSRNTVGDWLSLYEQGGVARLLYIGTPPGRQPTLTEAQEAELRQALSDPSGFGSYGAVQAWVREKLQVEMKYDAVRKLVRYKLGAKLKVPRRSHIKKP